jgi:hypothetical protein
VTVSTDRKAEQRLLRQYHSTGDQRRARLRASGMNRSIAASRARSDSLDQPRGSSDAADAESLLETLGSTDDELGLAFITDARLDVPTALARFGPWLYAVNARFAPNGDNKNPTEDVIRLPR